MKQRVYFPERTKAIVVAEGFDSVQNAQTAVDYFLQDVTYNEQPESGFRYCRKEPAASQQKKEKFIFNILSY